MSRCYASTDEYRQINHILQEVLSMSTEQARLILYKNLLFGDLQNQQVQSTIWQCVKKLTEVNK